MTERQHELLTYIKEYIFKHGYSPTLEEMKHRLNIRSVSPVHAHLRLLVKQGYLKRNGYKRGYELPVTNQQKELMQVVTEAVDSSLFASLNRSGISKTEVNKIANQVKHDVVKAIKTKL